MLGPGDVIADRYEIEELIGEGGLAQVWKVRHRDLGSLHALKMLLFRKPRLAERLILEGRIQAQLKHPNIVTVTDVVRHGGQVGLVMEFVDGVALQTWLEVNAPLEVDRALELFAPILGGVRAAHDAGVLHRDLKPANILLARHGRGLVPKVTDFGIAKVVEGTFEAVDTRTGAVMGTPGYLAPEQAVDASKVDRRADVFALGAILYEMLTGRRAFESLEAYVQQGRADPAPLAELRPDCPTAVVAAVHKALAWDPSDRFPEVSSFAAELFDGRPALMEMVGTSAPRGEAVTLALGNRTADATRPTAVPTRSTLPSTPASTPSLTPVPPTSPPAASANPSAGPPSISDAPLPRALADGWPAWAQAQPEPPANAGPAAEAAGAAPERVTIRPPRPGADLGPAEGGTWRDSGSLASGGSPASGGEAARAWPAEAPASDGAAPAAAPSTAGAPLRAEAMPAPGGFLQSYQGGDTLPKPSPSLADERSSWKDVVAAEAGRPDLASATGASSPRPGASAPRRALVGGAIGVVVAIVIVGAWSAWPSASSVDEGVAGPPPPPEAANRTTSPSATLGWRNPTGAADPVAVDPRRVITPGKLPAPGEPAPPSASGEAPPPATAPDRQPVVREAPSREVPVRDVPAAVAPPPEDPPEPVIVKQVTAPAIPSTVQPSPPPPAAPAVATPSAPPSVKGKWTGKANGLPLELSFTTQSGSSISGEITIFTGPTESHHRVRGTIEPDGSFVLTATDGDLVMRGKAVGGTMQGTYGPADQRRALTWNAKR